MAEKGIAMYYVFQIVDVIAFVMMFFMLAVIINQQPSRAQLAFILYDVGTIVFVVGIHLELIHADTVEAALSGLCVQYFGQTAFLMALLWFVSEFVKLHIPKWIYMMQLTVNIITLVGVFTAEHHTYFYKTMKILQDGMYNRIVVTDGIIWYLHYIDLAAVFLGFFIMCSVRYPGSTSLQKKRIRYVITGIGVMCIEMIMKGLGVFGSYNPVVFVVTVMMFCMMVAMLRYGYFGSLQAAVDNAFNYGDEGLLVLDKDNIIIYINQRMNMIYPGLKEGDQIYRQKEILDALFDGSHILKRGNVTFEIRPEDIIENGEKGGCMLWFIDQTEHLKTMEQLREANESKTRFMMKMSHELRTPMNTIMGMSEMILRESKDEQIRDYALEVETAGNTMISMVEEILEMSRIEKENQELAIEPYDLSEMLVQAEKVGRHQAEEKGLCFQAENRISGSDSIWLMGDERRLLQILINLLSNAVQYTDKGTISLTAEKVYEEENAFLEFVIRDTGMGIAEADRSRIFEAFERGRSAQNGRKEGLGLGLAIVMQLVDAMDGTLKLYSELGKGTTFIVRIPYLEADPEKVAESNNRQKQKEEIALQGIRILAVDDNEKNLMVFRQLMKKTEADITVVSSGKEAITCCREHTYDLIFLDHMMPELDGIETIHRIKEDENGENKKTPVIALTANATQGARELYQGEGFSDYLAKPFTSESLYRVIRKELFFAGYMQALGNAGIDTEKGLKYADSDRKFYYGLLDLFAGQREEQEKKLEEVRDFRQFTVIVHALKGEARGIGADALGEMFAALEQAGKEEDQERIREMLPETQKEWKKVTGVIESKKNVKFFTE